MRRETAWRLFASEYNDSRVEIKGRGEKAPSYVVTPLGAKVNRLFIVGVLTDVENISEGGDLVRAHISDPTGVFTLYSGQYQQDATNALLNISVPAFVAVLGKSRTYAPEEGTLYVSVRPEIVKEVDAHARNQWILETCRSTRDRINAMGEAMKLSQVNAFDLRKIGYSYELSEGIVASLNNYENIDLKKYVTLISESLQYLTSFGDAMLTDMTQEKEKVDAVIDEEIEADEKILADIEEISEDIEPSEDVSEIEFKSKDKIKESKEEVSDDFQEIENKVLDVVRMIEGEDGASWDDIIKKCEEAGLDKDSVEEALTSLMDKGMIYEPVLGVIKTT